MATGSNASTYNPYDLFKLYKNGSKFGSYTPRHLNLSNDLTVSEDTTNNFYTLGTAVSNDVIYGSYTVYIDTDGSVKARNNFTAAIDYHTTSAPANSTDTTTLFNNVFTALASTGGLIFVKRGTYVINATGFVGTSGTPLPYIALQGEARENTIIKMDSTATAANMIKCWCSFDCRGITLDANTKGLHLIDQQQGPYLYVDNVHFKPGHEIGLFTGNLLQGAVVRNNYFDITPDTFDQYAASMSTTLCQYLLIENNYFDKRTGTTDGSSLTSAAYNNAVIRGNVIDRAVGHLVWGISMENWNHNYSNITVDSNVINNGTISIGGNTSAGITWDNLNVSNNVITGGSVSLFSGNSTVLRGIKIDNNTINNPWGAGIYTEATGHHTISNNIIRESNQGLNASTGSVGAICIFDNASNIEIFGNTTVQTDTRTNASPYAVRIAINNTNIRIFDNKFYNTTSNGTVFGPFGGQSNIKMWDNLGYVTNLDGVTTFSGTGSQTAFTVTHGLAVTPTIVNVSTNQTIATSVTAPGSTTFTVNFATAPASGTNNVTVYWHAEKKVIA